MLDSILKAGLTPTVDTDYDRWKPLHWILTVPDVMERGGFDAIIGNPPFLGGQKLTGALGTNMRDWFVNVLASRSEGQRRSGRLLLPAGHVAAYRAQGNLGLIATNTVAQGDTREVGLDQMVSRRLHDHPSASRAARGQRPALTWNTQRCGELAVTWRHDFLEWLTTLPLSGSPRCWSLPAESKAIQHA